MSGLAPPGSRVAVTLAAQRKPTPSPTDLRAPEASALEAAGALLAIALALAAGVLGYRIIRGGRGL